MRIENLIKEFDKSTVKESHILNFIGVDGYDVYNITAPFMDDGKMIIAGRVEKRDSEDSYVHFFAKKDENTYELVTEYPSLHLQDPYFTFIKDELILGGTEIFPDPLDSSKLSYRAVKYRGQNIKSLKPFFKGPERMKDIRLKELENGKILCLTRPQGEYGGRGQIGYLIVNTLEELSREAIKTAPLLNSFDTEEWGGANEIYNLTSEQVGVLGHIAKFDDEGNRHYYAMSFVFNHQTGEYSQTKLLLMRAQLEDGPAKRDDLIDVIFSGGLINLAEENVEIFVGVSDAAAHRATIANPFKINKENK